MSNLVPTAAAEPCVSEPTAPTLEALPGRLTDLGGLPIRRLLPRSRRRLVGSWCFLDSYGPLTFSSGKPMDVAPHRHIGLQTVSWLLEGELVHHDSLGLAGPAGPGVLNLMTAGRVRAPGRAFSPMVGADVSGELDRQALSIDTLYYLGCGRRDLVLVSDREPARLLLLGGAPFGETILMWWNFVARTTEEIMAAREDWRAGRRFGEVRADR